MRNFAIYLIGAIILATAAAFGLHKLNVDAIWIIVVCLIIIGISIMAGVSKTQRKE